MRKTPDNNSLEPVIQSRLMRSMLRSHGSSEPRIEQIRHFLPRLRTAVVHGWKYSGWTNKLNERFQFITAAMFTVRHS